MTVHGLPSGRAVKDQYMYLQNYLVVARWERFSISVLSHKEPLQIMGDKDRGVKHHATLNFTVFFLVNVLNRNQDIFLPMRTKGFMRGQIHMTP